MLEKKQLFFKYTLMFIFINNEDFQTWYGQKIIRIHFLTL